MSVTAHPLHEIFRGRAQGVGHLMRDRVWRMVGFSSDEALLVELIPGLIQPYVIAVSQTMIAVLKSGISHLWDLRM